MNNMKRQKGMIQKDKPLMLESVPYATGEELREITNSSRKNEEWKQCSVVDVSGGESKF